MKKNHLFLLCVPLLLAISSCNNSGTTEPPIEINDYGTESEEDAAKDEPQVIRHKYDLSVLSEECLEMLDKYEEMQAKLKDASNAAKINRADQELQDKYYLMLQENQKLLEDTRMVDCSNDVNFQYAMSDISDKYFK